MDKREFIAMTAKMDGNRVIAESTSRKVKVSEMELIVLCNLAQLGLWSLFSCLDGQSGDDAHQEMTKLVDAIRDELGSGEKPDGIRIISTAGAAILAGERLGKYLVEVPKE